MSLPIELISQFVKTTNDNKTAKKETTVYGEVVKYDHYDGSGQFLGVKIDGSDVVTPVSTTANVEDGERVTVLIKDHTATITGNMSAPSAPNRTVAEHGNKIAEFETVMAYRISSDEITAFNASIENLRAITARFTDVDAANALIDKLEASLATFDKVSAKDVEVLNADIENLRGIFGWITDITTEDLDAAYAEIDQLRGYTADFTYVSADVLHAIKAEVDNGHLKYATIDFANVGEAAFEYFYSKSGLIDNIVISDGNITGMLVGVTIKGDLIEGNTIRADKLVVLGEDGLYYKLNFEAGTFTDGEEVPTDGLHGSVIVAKSITAEKVNVDDLVAFDATIGGFNITSDSIYSEVKDSEGNMTRGIYLDKEGQVNIGDSSNFIKYIRDDDGNFHLVISASDILYSLNGTPHSLADLGAIGEYVHVGIFEDEPCIELGESDSNFKLLITNTRILFMDGSVIPAHVSNQSLHIKKAVIEEELQFGQFVWQKRANGNMGLIWKDEIAEVNT